MDYSEYIAKRIVQHLNEHGLFGDKIRRHKDKHNNEYVDILGITFGVKLENRSLERIIDPNEQEKEFKKFKEHIRKINTMEFWENPSLSRLKERMRSYREYFSNPILSREEACYIFKSELTTDNKDNVFFAILNNVIRPVILYKTQNNSG